MCGMPGVTDYILRVPSNDDEAEVFEPLLSAFLSEQHRRVSGRVLHGAIGLADDTRWIPQKVDAGEWFIAAVSDPDLRRRLWESVLHDQQHRS